MNSTKGLMKLYEAFGKRTFSGVELRNVMVGVMGGPTVVRVGWLASTQLGRLVRSNMVEVMEEDPNAKAAWGHTYRLSNHGLATLGMTIHEDPADETDRIEQYRDLILRSEGKAITKDWFIDPDRLMALRIVVVSEWAKLAIRLTPEGREMAAEQASA